MSPKDNVAKNSSEKGEKKSKFNFKSKKLRVLLSAALAVLVLGGVTAALVVNSIYNRPENVLASAMGKYLLDGKDKNFDATINVKMLDEASAASGMNSVDFKLGVQMAGKTTQMEMEANLAIFRLRGAVQMNENGNLYVQMKDLPALLGSDLATAYGIPEEMKQQMSALDSKWIEIKKADLAQLTGQEAGTTSELDKCMEGIYGALDNEALANDFDKFYRKNKFLLANNPVEENVGGRNLLKVEVGLDDAKLKAFGEEFGKTAGFVDLATKCGLSSEESTANEATDDLRNAKMTVWLDRGKRELVKLEASGDNFAEEVKASELKLSMQVKPPVGEIKAPTEVINVMELVQMFGVDPSSLGEMTSPI